MKKLTPEEKQAFKKKLQESGVDEERGKKLKLTLSDDKKKQMKEMLAQAEHERLGKLDRMLHSRKSKKA